MVDSGIGAKAQAAGNQAKPKLKQGVNEKE
jgi:hypothetical protein